MRTTAALAIALPVSLIPVSASAAAAQHQQPAISVSGPRTLPDGQPAGHYITITIGRGSQATRGVRPDNPWAGLCLYNSVNYCASMSPVEWEAVILGGVKVVRELIEIYKLIFKSGDSTEDQEEETLNGKNHLSNECLGTWQLYARVEMGHCNSHHGVFWREYQAIKGNKVAFFYWNTYTHGWLTTLAPRQGVTIWTTPAGKDWQKWFYRDLT